MSYVPKIDEIDVRILKILLLEARSTFAEIAKDCGLSITSIRNRFNIMVKSGIITGSIAQIYPKNLGYDCVAFIKVDVNPKFKKETQEFIESNPHIAVYSAHATGRSSIIGFAVTSNADELSQVVHQIRNNSNVRSVATEIWIDQKYLDLPQNLIVKQADELSNQDYPLPEKRKENDAQAAERYNRNEKAKLQKPHEIDDIDISLIRMLTKDARLPFREIAKDLGISANNVIRRYKELRKTTLSSSSITVNLKKLGYIGTGVLTINVSNNASVDETFSRIVQIPNVIVAIKILGNFDILAITPFRTFEDITNLTEEISKTSDIAELELSIDEPYTSWPLNMISKIITEKLIG